MSGTIGDRCYLGDGVYAAWDGQNLILTAENGICATDTIYIDGQVWSALVDYIEQLKVKARG